MVKKSEEKKKNPPCFICKVEGGQFLFFFFLKMVHVVRKLQKKNSEIGYGCRKGPNCKELRNLNPRLRKCLNRILKCNYAIKSGTYLRFSQEEEDEESK